MQERTPEQFQNKVASSVTVTSMKWQLYLTPSTYTLWSPSHLYFSHLRLHFIPQHTSPCTSAHQGSFCSKTHFFISRCFLEDRGICLHYIDGSLPTIVSGTLSSGKNFLVSWVELFTEIFIEKIYLTSQISPIICALRQSVHASSTYTDSIFGLGKNWENQA